MSAIPPAPLASDPLDQLSRLVRGERAQLVAAALAEGAMPEEAVECVQEALCTFLGWPERDALAGDPVRELAALKTMVRNAARNLRRRHHRSKIHEPVDDQVVELQLDAEALLTHAEDVVRLRTCVAELCGIQRAVVTLRLLEEQSGEDVATELGLTRGHVDVLIHRAKSALRMCMRASEHGARERRRD